MGEDRLILLQKKLALLFTLCSGKPRAWARGGGLFALPRQVFFLLWSLLSSPKIRGAPGPSPTALGHTKGEWTPSSTKPPQEKALVSLSSNPPPQSPPFNRVNDILITPRWSSFFLFMYLLTLFHKHHTNLSKDSSKLYPHERVT